MMMIFLKLPVQMTGLKIAATILVKPTPEPTSKIVEFAGSLLPLNRSQSAKRSAPRQICSPTKSSTVLRLCSVYNKE